MKKLFLMPVLAALFCSTLTAQPERGFNALSAKVLFIDYGRPNGVDGQDVTNGLEVGYLRSFNQYFGIAIPFKAGVANMIGDINNRTIVSLDGILHLCYQKNEESRFVPYIFGGGGFVIEDFEDRNFQVPLGAGFNVRVGRNSYINAQGEYRVSQIEDRHNLQLGLGYIYRFGKSDRDGDGIADANDLCPDVPGESSASGCPDMDGDGIADADDLCPAVAGLAAFNGCPDRDGDGVIDGNDHCPDVPGTLQGCPDQDKDGIADKEDRCPETAGTAALQGCPDRDGDGLADQDDACPDEAGSLANKGCPIRDADGDGVADESDLCPDLAGSPKTGGCPDRDEDGVADKDDRCPDKAGPYSGCPDTDGDGLMDADDSCPESPGPVTNKGCPTLSREVQEVLTFAMQAVQFETGKATLKSESSGILDQIVEIMNRYPDYSLSIAGHTDNVGDEDANLVLSGERAKACYQYLASKGISPKRLSYQGFGESQPVADNKTAAGRRLNRRVEFNLYIP